MYLPLSEFDKHLLTVHGLLEDGRLHTIDAADLPQSDGGAPCRLVGRSAGPDSSVADGAGWFADRLRSEGRLVCKRFKGGSGKQVFICVHYGESYTITDELRSEAGLRRGSTAWRDIW